MSLLGKKAMRSAMRMGSAVLLLLLSIGPASAQERWEQNPLYYHGDQRLHVRLNVDGDRPTVAHILAWLRQATGVEFDVADNLRDHAPDFGIIQPCERGYRAFVLMEILAETQLQDGHWEETERGYRLAGTSLAPAASAAPVEPEPPAAPSRILEWLLALAAVLAGVVGLWLLGRAGRRKAPRQRHHRGAQAPPLARASAPA